MKKQLRNVSRLLVALVLLIGASSLFAEDWHVQFSISNENTGEDIISAAVIQIFDVTNPKTARYKAKEALGFFRKDTKRIGDNVIRLTISDTVQITDNDGYTVSKAKKRCDWYVIYYVIDLTTYTIFKDAERIQVRSQYSKGAFYNAKKQLDYDRKNEKRINGRLLKIVPYLVCRPIE